MILQDGSKYWDLGINNGDLAWNVTSLPSSGVDLVYLVDTVTGLYYQITIQGGELYWTQTTDIQVGGSSGPINPYDYINIFTEEHFERRVVVKGDKSYLVGTELGFEGSKSFYDGTSLKVFGFKDIAFNESRKCKGDKQYQLEEYKRITGDRQLDDYNVMQFAGTKQWHINERRSAVGIRDITNILEALDLI